MFDLEDDNSFDFTVLDRAKIEDLELNQKMEAENGSFMVVRKGNGYHVWSVGGLRRGTFRCLNIKEVFDFLENN
jgi:hypothetical protein